MSIMFKMNNHASKNVHDILVGKNTHIHKTEKERQAIEEVNGRKMWWECKTIINSFVVFFRHSACTIVNICLLELLHFSYTL